MAVPCADAHRRSPARAAGFSPTAGPSVGLTAGLSLAALVTAALVSPGRVDDGPVICPFRLLTGLPCPGCGLTRSWVHLTHGQLADGLAANPFGAVSLVLAVMLVVACGVVLVRRRALPAYADLFGPSRSRRRLALAMIAVAWVGFGLVRLVVTAVS